jgi:regulatory protein
MDEETQARGVEYPSGRQVDWARRAALRYLERYATSESNLARVLKRKVRRRCAADPENWALSGDAVARLVAATVASCRELGLVDDRGFAETRVASGRRRGHSDRRLRSVLAAKGVARDTAEAAIEVAAATEERAALIFARKRRLGPFAPAGNDGEARKRALASLCRQGFDYGLARIVATMDRETAEQRIAGEGA